MAAPPSKTVRDLNGTWVMNKTLSDSVDPGLALQGIGWLTRKGIGLATVTIAVKQYTDDAGAVHVDIQQTATGGIKGTSETRTLDNEFHDHSDWLFGKVKGRTEWVSSPVPPAVGDAFLGENWEEGSTEWIHSYVESLENGWTAELLWGFQIVHGERRHVRNTVIKKGNKKEEMRLVYDFVPEA